MYFTVVTVALPDQELFLLKLLGQHGQEEVELVDVDVPWQLFTERRHGVNGTLLQSLGLGVGLVQQEGGGEGEKVGDQDLLTDRPGVQDPLHLLQRPGASVCLQGTEICDLAMIIEHENV